MFLSQLSFEGPLISFSVDLTDPEAPAADPGRALFNMPSLLQVNSVAGSKRPCSSYSEEDDDQEDSDFWVSLPVHHPIRPTHLYHNTPRSYNQPHATVCSNRLFSWPRSSVVHHNNFHLCD